MTTSLTLHHTTFRASVASMLVDPRLVLLLDQILATRYAGEWEVRA